MPLLASVASVARPALSVRQLRASPPHRPERLPWNPSPACCTSLTVHVYNTETLTIARGAISARSRGFRLTASAGWQRQSTVAGKTRQQKLPSDLPPFERHQSGQPPRSSRTSGEPDAPAFVFVLLTHDHSNVSVVSCQEKFGLLRKNFPFSSILIENCATY